MNLITKLEGYNLGNTQDTRQRNTLQTNLRNISGTPKKQTCGTSIGDLSNT